MRAQLAASIQQDKCLLVSPHAYPYPKLETQKGADARNVYYVDPSVPEDWSPWSST